MLRIFDLVAQVAPSRATVLITGEREPARADRESDPRSLRESQPGLRRVQLRSRAAGPDRSTLFGLRSLYHRACFRKGYFETADRGTFLTRFRLSLETQPSSCASAEKEFMPVGFERTSSAVDVRLIAATMDGRPPRSWIRDEGRIPPLGI